MSWIIFEKDWKQYILELKNSSLQPDIVKTRRWYFHNFENEKAANRYLAYVKSMLPDQREELSKADVKYDTARKVYFFRLSEMQYVSYLSLEEEISKFNKESKNEIESNTFVMTESKHWYDSFFGKGKRLLNAKLSLANDKKQVTPGNDKKETGLKHAKF